MGQWIGSLAGLAMMVLILIFLGRFLREIGVLLDWKKILGKCLLIFGIAILELTLYFVNRIASVNDTVMWDVSYAFQDVGLIGEGLAPFNWYASLFLGTLAFYGLYRILEDSMGEEAGFHGLWLLLVIPYSYFCFLPVTGALAFAVLSLGLRIGDIYSGHALGRGLNRMREKLAMGHRAYYLLLAVLAAINGISMVQNLGA